MDKEAVLQFLQNQLSDNKADTFDLDVFKSSVGNTLKLAFGDQSPYYKQIANLSHQQKMSFDELYPKKIDDVKATFDKATQLLKSLIQQIECLDAKDFKSVKNIKSDTVANIKKALQNNLTGTQTKHLKNFIAAHNDTALLVEQLRQLDSEAVLRILSEILLDKDIW